MKWGHPSDQDILIGPEGGQIREGPLYSFLAS